MKEKKFTFIDLFAGLGGFHLALEQLGGKCVFASELKEDLRKFYQQNFGIECHGDITKINPKDIPAHDVICGGFPCQPFSKAGYRQGFHDEKDRGNLFFKILDIIKEHKPKYVFLENVANLRGHDNGNTWKVIRQCLEDEDYDVDAAILSPHQYGYPQHRTRFYIVGVRRDIGSLSSFRWPQPADGAKCNIESVLDDNVVEYRKIKKETQEQLDVWQEFLNNLYREEKQIPGHPIWAMEFGATYDYESTAPAFQQVFQLHGKKGHLGRTITGTTIEECLAQLPNYAVRRDSTEFPEWKKKYIRQNRDLYLRNKKWIDKWLLKVANYENSHLKFEWNCGNAEPIIHNKMVQLRASGIRVKLPNYAPALNLCTTQTPILPWLGRYMTVREISRLQGMDMLVDKASSEGSPITMARLSAAFGNAVNVNVVKLIGEQLIKI